MERYLTDLLRGFSGAGVATRVVVRRADPQIARELGPEVAEMSGWTKPRMVAKVAFYLRARRWLRRHSGEATMGLARGCLECR